MVLGGALGDDQPLGDLPVGKSFGNQSCDLGLAPAQEGRPVGAAATDLRDESGGAIDIRRHAQRSRQTVSIPGSGLGTVAIAGAVAGQ